MQQQQAASGEHHGSMGLALPAVISAKAYVTGLHGTSSPRILKTLPVRTKRHGIHIISHRTEFYYLCQISMKRDRVGVTLLPSYHAISSSSVSTRVNYHGRYRQTVRQTQTDKIGQSWSIEIITIHHTNNTRNNSATGMKKLTSCCSSKSHSWRMCCLINAIFSATL